MIQLAFIYKSLLELKFGFLLIIIIKVVEFIYN